LDDGWVEIVQSQIDALISLAHRERNSAVRAALLAANRRLHQLLREYMEGPRMDRRFELKAEMCRTIAEWCADPDDVKSYRNLFRLYQRMAGNAERNAEIA
jgi:hypothetical protein